MTHVSDDRIAQRQIHKFAERRAQLAQAALKTLAELGYARTSLRGIAQNSEFSHGVLHYYFTDKVDLITYCVKLYKAECVKRYDEIVSGSRTPAELRQGFAEGLAATMVEDSQLHRLWYDLRTQALFEAAFRADVSEIDLSLQRMIWRIVERYAQLRGTTPSTTPELAYGVFDGLFQQALMRHIFGDTEAPARLRSQVGPTLDALFA